MSINSNTSSPTTATSGTSVSGGSVNLQTNSGALAALLIMGMFIAAAADDIRAPQSQPQPMDPQRKVVEQDCTKPIDPALGNLRCK